MITWLTANHLCPNFHLNKVKKKKFMNFGVLYCWIGESLNFLEENEISAPWLEYLFVRPTIRV